MIFYLTTIANYRHLGPAERERAFQILDGHAMPDRQTFFLRKGVFLISEEAMKELLASLERRPGLRPRLNTLPIACDLNDLQNFGGTNNVS